MADGITIIYIYIYVLIRSNQYFPVTPVLSMVIFVINNSYELLLINLYSKLPCPQNGSTATTDEPFMEPLGLVVVSEETAYDRDAVDFPWACRIIFFHSLTAAFGFTALILFYPNRSQSLRFVFKNFRLRLAEFLPLGPNFAPHLNLAVSCIVIAS